MARSLSPLLLVTFALVGCAASPPEGSLTRSHGAASERGADCVEGEEGCPVDPVDPPVCVESEVLALQPLDVSALDPSRAAFNARCGVGEVWCSLALRAYTYPTCLEAEPTLGELTALALAETAFEDQQRDFSSPETFDQATLGTQLYFDHYGPGLQGDIDAFAGATVLEAMGFVEAGRCLNCHIFLVRYILVYPATRTVVVVDGHYGYDS